MQTTTLKAAEKAKRDSATKIFIKSPKSKIPRDFSNFLSNGENKFRMIELLIHTTKEKILHILNALRTLQMIFSHEQECVSIKLIGCSLYFQCLAITKRQIPNLLPSQWKHCRQNFYFRYRNFRKQKFIEFSINSPKFIWRIVCL